MTLEIWLTFVFASTVLLMIPGPTILLVLSYAMSKGRSVALASAAGVALGDLVAMSASLAGLGALVLASSTAFIVLKWAGAAYLVYMGVNLLRSASSHGIALSEGAADVTPRRVFTQAATVTALNPKSIAFFVAFVPQFLQADAPLLPQIMILIGTFVGLATLNALAYALLADKLRSVISKPSVLAWLTRAGGLTLIGMGVLTATLRRAA
ncbi:LysE family translocator [Lentibacter algarum]|uniref:LysE family translocator n=1 Tax=Lentibacter algarum TaxID=576131 RepID=UPI001C09A136|nr:LysE family translocator [Lentibacter algarum]MBU2982937.1 LysE family translocator [Lentibacter algarum]